MSRARTAANAVPQTQRRKHDATERIGAGDGKPTQSQGEDEEQHRAERRARNRDAHDGKTHRHRIDPRSFAPGGKNAEDNAEENSDHHRTKCQPSSVRKARPDDAANGQSGPIAFGLDRAGERDEFGPRRQRCGALYRVRRVVFAFGRRRDAVVGNTH